jgi:hypothetical protein
MSAEPFLHDHSNFKDLILIVSDKLHIVPQLAEKDYWIMHCLWGMQQQKLSFVNLKEVLLFQKDSE